MSYKRSHPAPKNHEQAKSPVPVTWVCGCPPEHCRGQKCGDQEDTRVHSTWEAVKSCQEAYLLKTGHKKLSGREWLIPAGMIGEGTIRVLSRRPTRAKSGKEKRPARGKMGRIRSL